MTQEVALEPSAARSPIGSGRVADLLGSPTFSIVAFYVLVIAFFLLRAPAFRDWSNVSSIAMASTTIGIVAMGQTLVIVVGGFDLSVAGVAPLASVLYAICLAHDYSVLAATLVALAVGALVGLINGILVTRLKINPLITTLGMLSVAGGTAAIVTNGVAQGITNTAAGVWGEGAFFGVNRAVVAVVLIGVLLGAAMRYTVFGRTVYAVGGNREASRLAGIRVDAVTSSAYVISGTCAAFAGVVAASQLLAGASTIGSDLALSSVAAVVLGGAALTGGVGTVGGTLLGVLVLGTIANGLALMQVQSFYQQVASGGVLLLAVAFGGIRTRLFRTAR